MDQWASIELLLAELIDHQKKLTLNYARRILPIITSDDILQPNDFPELENNPHFRYEEGILAGLQAAQVAVNTLRTQDKKN